ncbi:DUF2795 domain-containing protein [Lysobacter korlensis]|uniref:DUF2795 domain-containing protein n=1 Tax=Lysobacter korlensis TaxID=553636 RepID=A0ABV6RJB4_9GAMM
MTRGVGGESPSNVQQFLKGVSYPADKAQLLDQARRNGAPEEIQQIIEAFDEDEFGGPQDVMKAYGRTH